MCLLCANPKKTSGAGAHREDGRLQPFGMRQKSQEKCLGNLGGKSKEYFGLRTIESFTHVKVIFLQDLEGLQRLSPA